jgi:glutaredoxin
MNKNIIIDFLYLDLVVCDRCVATESNLAEAINEVSELLKLAGYSVIVNKIEVTTKELAKKYEFLSSPTIRINGNDICFDVKENACGCCSDISGEAVDCRVFLYDGIEYDHPPKAMIINSILKEIYGEKEQQERGKYILPNNLKVFFDGKNAICCDDNCSYKCN